MIPSTLTYSWPAVTGSFLYPWQTEMGEGDGWGKRNWLARQYSSSSSIPAKTNHLPDTSHRCHWSQLYFSEHTTCLSSGGGSFQAPFWDLPFHSLLIMHFSLLTKGQWSFMEGKMCRGNAEHTMCIITYHKTEQKPKGKVYFPQNSLSSISSHNW